MKKSFLYLTCLLVVTALTVVAYGFIAGGGPQNEPFVEVGRQVKITPDYSGLVIPPNIAPLNFIINEKGLSYYVKISSAAGLPIEIRSNCPSIEIPLKAWRKLLETNKGGVLNYDVSVKAKDGKWQKFLPFTNKIAAENIDPYLAYRKVNPVRRYMTTDMGIFQRDLTNFRESVILDIEHFEGGCLNCHTFCGNNPDKMLIAFRSDKYGSETLLVENGEVEKIGARFTYSSWHPSGTLATFSINNVEQFVHTARNEVRDVIDLDSTIVYYLDKVKEVQKNPQFSQKDRLETYSSWSPDGKYMYFCSAPMLWPQGQKDLPPPNYEKIKYDLMRISYDVEKNTWGNAETVLSAKQTGKSILFPRISPDGRWLLVSMCRYSCFSAYQEDSDIYIIDLDAAKQTGQYEYRKLELNSDKSDSWHCWSSNGRWIVFSSKRYNGKFTKPYFAYFDETGKTYKPFVLPQKDPEFYNSFLKMYNLPELITGSVTITGEKLGRVVRGTSKIPVKMPITMATPKATKQASEKDFWKQNE